MKRIIWIAATVQFVLAVIDLVSRFWGLLAWGAPIGPEQIAAFVGEAPWTASGMYPAILIVGAVVGWLVSRTPDGGAPQQAARAGSRAGIGALVGFTLTATVLMLFLGTDPHVQQALILSEPNPEARLRADLVPLLATVAGVVGGGLAGLAGLGLSALGAWLGGLLGGRTRQPELGSAPRS